MVFFLATYLGIYGGMTAYVFLRLSRGLGGPARVWVPIWLGAAGMMFLPVVLHRLADRLGPVSGRLLAGAAWVWLALVFWALSLFAAVDLWNAVAGLAGLVRPGLAAYRIPGRAGALGVLGVLPVLCAWGWVEAGLVSLRTVELDTPRLPAGAALRLVQISDMHLGFTSRRAVWMRAVALVRQARPDVLVSTGDLVDAPAAFLEPWLAELDAVRAPLGKYAVLGNHEAYTGIARSVELLNRAGFSVLRDSTVRPHAHLVLTGIDDPACRRRQGAPPDGALPAARPEDAFAVVLQHQPRPGDAARRNADLQLSGHTHGGQINPFGWVVRLVHPHPHSRLVAFPEGLRLYVSRGTGTWGPPFRFLAPAEVTLFVIRGTGPGSRVSQGGG